MEIIQNLENILELPENINGLEIHHSPFTLSPKVDDIAPYIETCRVFQEVYFHITCARYCLLIANETEHPKVCKDAKGYAWYRGLNANTSIMWYNAAFDILLQTLWIYKDLYKEHNFGKKKGSVYYDKINSDSLLQILEGCTLGRIKKYLNNESLAKELELFCQKHSVIHELGNSLKHRNGVKYKDFYPLPNISYADFYEKDDKIVINENGYNSSHTLSLWELKDTVEKLKDFHIQFLTLIGKIYSFMEFDELFMNN